MQKTISISTPREPHASLRHDRREYGDGQWPENIDRSRCQYNVVYENHSIYEVYEQLFSEAIKEYDANQKRADRQIGDAKNYLDKIAHSKQQSEVNEVILQFGDMFSNGYTGDINAEEFQLASTLLDELAEHLQEKFPNFATVCMVKHMDEATPHIHWAFVPYGTYEKGQSVRVSVDKACQQMGYTAQNGKLPIQRALEGVRTEMANIAKSHGLTIEHPSGKTQHKRIEDYKRDAQNIRDELSKLPTPEQLHVKPATFDKSKVVMPKEDYDALLERVKLTEQHNSIVDIIMREVKNLRERAQDYLNKVVSKVEELANAIKEYKAATTRISPAHVEELEQQLNTMTARAERVTKSNAEKDETIQSLKEQNAELKDTIKVAYQQGLSEGHKAGYKECMDDHDIKPPSHDFGIR